MNKLRTIWPVGRLLGAGDVFVGIGSLGVLPALGAARLAALVSPSVADSEYFQTVIKALGRRTAVEVIVIPSGEPMLQALRDPVQKLLDFAPDWILAAGGGSVIDAAKIVWALYEQSAISFNSFDRPFTLPPLRSKCRFVAVPTTNGAGSEASSTAVFQLEEGSRKSFLVSHELIPDVVILDPKVAVDLPTEIIASSGMDALAHALEGYLSRLANPLSDGLAIASANVFMRCLRDGVDRRDDMDTRVKLMAAAYHAGCVQNVALPGIGHAVAHQLASLGVSHARGTGSLLEHAIQWSADCPSNSNKALELSRALGFGSTELLVREIGNLRLDLGIVLNDVEPDWAGLAQNECFLSGVASDPCSRASVRAVDADSVRGFIQVLRS